MIALALTDSPIDILDLVDWLGTIGCLILMTLYFKRRLVDVQAQLSECEDDRETLHVKCTKLEATIGHIEKKMMP